MNNNWEEQWLTSLDDPAATPVTPAQQDVAVEYLRIRQQLLRKQPATFGPYFARKVVDRISAASASLDFQILFFFRKYQLAAIGFVVALLAFNTLSADKLSVKSIIGIEEATATSSPDSTNDDTMTSFDFYSDLTNN